MATCTHFIEQLDKLTHFRLHTGNVNAYTELKLKRFNNSAEELKACLNIQLRSQPQCNEFRDQGTLLLCDNAHISEYDRVDLKITLKVFLSSWDPSEMKEAVTSLMDLLKTSDIELLIISTPELEVIQGESDQDELERWISSIKPIWEYLSSLTEEGKVVSLGLSEATMEQLDAMVKLYDVKPMVNHLRHDGCCAVPAELKEFADNNDIQLLTHNDPNPFPTAEIFRTFCNIKDTVPVCCNSYSTTWAARYTVWVRRRSIMASKGYLVQFDRNT